jgi:hypothetical protein
LAAVEVAVEAASALLSLALLALPEVGGAEAVEEAVAVALDSR